jgi:hypothetical protein
MTTNEMAGGGGEKERRSVNKKTHERTGLSNKERSVR